MVACLHDVLVCLSILVTVTLSTAAPSTQDAADQFLRKYNSETSDVKYKNALAGWTYQTNLTDHNQRLMNAQQLKSSEHYRKWSNLAQQLNISGVDNDTVKQIDLIKGHANTTHLDPATEVKFDSVTAHMEKIFSSTKVCMSDTVSACVSVPLDPDLTKTLSTSRSPDVLLRAWRGWHDAVGPPMKADYQEYVKLKNKKAQFEGYADAGAEWRSLYDDETFEDDVIGLWAQLKPLYEQLHGYVRRRLTQYYRNVTFPTSGHIPAHLLGNMWAQHWDHVYDLVTPFPAKKQFDVTQEMIRQNYTVHKMFHTADGFFTSLGLRPLPATFFTDSMLTRPTDGREVVCHPSAWDFHNSRDFRIKMCTEINQEMLNSVHHEMGHVQYYMQYSDQPQVYQAGANPGFHEAVGDTMQLSARTPKHLSTIGLLADYVRDNETDINFLMSMALTKVAFLPYGYLVDQWRWSVFRGDTTPEEYNDHWWQLKCRHQGVSSPVRRPASAFDPGAKSHVASDTSYIRYFVSFIIQYQFHKALCDRAGHKGALHTCDIYRNKEAGALIKSMLKLGSSKPWVEAMELLTGSRDIDARPLMEYYKPLLDFLRKENDNDYGWDPQCPTFSL